MSEITWQEAWDALRETARNYSGTSWAGFWLFGNSDSIKEVQRLRDCEARMKALEEEVLELRGWIRP